MDTKILLILGMHRSGTSLFANWLANCGLNIGDRLLPKGIGNKKGHFEDLDFLELQETILEENGYNWMFENGGDIVTNIYWKERAKSIINFKSKLHLHWGWKDPRTCLFLGFWKEIVPHAHKVVVFRDYKEVVASLISRDIKSLVSMGGRLRRFRIMKEKNKIYRDKDILANKYLNTWCIYNEHLIQYLEKDKGVLFVNIQEVSKMQKKIFSYFTNNLNFDFIESDFDRVFNIDLWGKQLYSGFCFDEKLEKRAESVLTQLELLQNNRFFNL